jgi:hypothetical protein
MDPDMDFDDDGPPMLVAADQSDGTDNLSADVDDINLKRVPITIITGMQLCSRSIKLGLIAMSAIANFAQAILVLVKPL